MLKIFFCIKEKKTIFLVTCHVGDQDLCTRIGGEKKKEKIVSVDQARYVARLCAGFSKHIISLRSSQRTCERDSAVPIYYGKDKASEMKAC